MVHEVNPEKGFISLHATYSIRVWNYHTSGLRNSELIRTRRGFLHAYRNNNQLNGLAPALQQGILAFDDLLTLL